MGQIFMAQHDGLNRIHLLLATYDRPNTHPLIFHAARMGRDLWATLRAEGGALLLAVLLFTLPGYALLVLLLPRPADELLLLLFGAPGLSAALAPLLLLAASLVGLPLGRAQVVAMLVIFALLALGGTARRIELSREQLITALRAALRLEHLLLLAILALSLAVRLWVVRDLTVPLWGDSMQHTLITRLLVENSGLFHSWEPYLPLRTFTYHFGFHTLVAFFHWLSGLTVVQSVILMGQFLNALAPLAAYLLAVWLTRNRWAGLGAALTAGLLSPMPMYYVNWGRYTQLTGHVILTAALVLALAAIERGGRRHMGLAAIALAGLALTHYLTVPFYALFLLPYLLILTYQRRSGGLQSATGPLVPWLRALGLGLLAVILVTPWIRNILDSPLPLVLLSRFRPSPVSGFFRGPYNAIGDPFFFAPAYLVAPALVGALWGLLRRQRGILLVILWVGLLFLMANPYVIGLPGTGTVNNFAVFITLYLPLSVLVGYLLGEMVALLGARWPWARVGVGVLVILAGLWGARERLPVLDSQFVLATKADEAAMAWIRENTPPQAKFLVNSFFAYGGSLVAGSDGGWWIPLLTGRRNTSPPLHYGMEFATDPDYRLKVNALVRQVLENPVDSPETLRLLREHGVTHVYIGEKGGKLQPQAFLASPHYRTVYHEGKVWIFEINY